MQRAKTALQLCMGLNPLLIVLQTNRLVFRSTNFTRFPSLPNLVLGIQIVDWRCQCYLTVVTITMPAASLVELINDCAGVGIAMPLPGQELFRILPSIEFNRLVGPCLNCPRCKASNYAEAQILMRNDSSP